MTGKQEREPQSNALFALSGETRWILWVTAVVLFFWESAGRLLQFRPNILPTPSRILLEVWNESAALQVNGRATFEEIVLGFFISLLLSVPAAGLMALLPGIRRYVTPLLLVMRRAPLLTLAPVLLAWFAFGMFSRTLVALLMSFFPTIEGILKGLRSIPEEMAELLRTMGAGKLQVLLRLHVPGSLPGFFGGLRSAVRLAISGSIVAEFVAADGGLGYLMLSGISKMDMPLVFAALAVLAAIGMGLYVVVVLLERILVPWRSEVAGRTGEYFESDVYPD